MRSSDMSPAAGASACGAAFATTVVLLLAACSPAPPQTNTSTTEVPCSTTGIGIDETSDLRRAVEAGPLFQAVAGNTALTSCRATADSEQVTLEYQFRDGGSMRATRDPSIEYTELVARFSAPPTQNALELLKRTERAALSPDGCDIDWTKPETEAGADEPATTEATYRGEICNCQGVVRTDAAGRVVTLTFRSAC